MPYKIIDQPICLLLSPVRPESFEQLIRAIEHRTEFRESEVPLQIPALLLKSLRDARFPFGLQLTNVVLIQNFTALPIILRLRAHVGAELATQRRIHIQFFNIVKEREKRVI